MPEETRWTPGPWRVGEHEEMDEDARFYARWPIFGQGRDGRPAHVATVQNWSEEVDAANGALLAAAPDLYAACVMALEHGEEQRHSWRAVRDTLRAALAKAEGFTQQGELAL